MFKLYVSCYYVCPFNIICTICFGKIDPDTKNIYYNVHVPCTPLKTTHDAKSAGIYANTPALHPFLNIPFSA